MAENRDRAVVKNAADRKQVKNADRRAKDQRELELVILRTVLSTAEGRALMWRLMTHCKTFNSVMAEGVDRIQYLAGKQDVGHFLQAEVLAAGDELYLAMQGEAYDALRKEERSIDADHTASATAKADTETEDANDDA